MFSYSYKILVIYTLDHIDIILRILAGMQTVRYCTQPSEREFNLLITTANTVELTYQEGA